MSAPLISIIGPPAVGKTTLAERLAGALPAEIFYEDFRGNPYLAASFTGRDDLLLPSQLYFLLARARQLAGPWPGEGVVVSDYGFAQDRLYAAARMNGDDLRAYDRVWSRVAPTVRRPDVLVHLDAALETLRGRIAGRGRAFEAAFTETFLDAMIQGNRTLAAQSECECLTVDCETTNLLDEGPRNELLAAIKNLIGM
jgi:deoxyadenosine/deoxycytidine kinase